MVVGVNETRCDDSFVKTNLPGALGNVNGFSGGDFANAAVLDDDDAVGDRRRCIQGAGNKRCERHDA